MTIARRNKNCSQCSFPREVIHTFHQILFLASTTITWEFTWLFPAPAYLLTCFKLHQAGLLCWHHLSQRSTMSLCSRCREGWARSRMNGSQLYYSWAMKPLSQVAAAPGQVAFVRAHMHACSLFVPTLSCLCWFPLCLSTTQAWWDCTVFQNGPYSAQPKCAPFRFHCLEVERCHGFWFLVIGIKWCLAFGEMCKVWTVT